MEDMTKHQMVLLTLFVSFVTSVATGIITVSLLDQAPVGVTQTVSKIVEHTIERIEPGKTVERVLWSSPVNKETAAYEARLSSDDAIASVVGQAKSSIVRVRVISSTLTDSDGSPRELYFNGALISKDGYVVSSKEVIASAPKEVEVLTSTGERFGAKLMLWNNAPVSIVKFTPSRDLNSLSLDLKAPNLGDSIVGVGYKNENISITLGHVSEVPASADGAGVKGSYATDIARDVPLISMDGALIGFNNKDSSLASASDIGLLVKQVIAALTTPNPSSAATATPAGQAGQAGAPQITTNGEAAVGASVPSSSATTSTSSPI